MKRALATNITRARNKVGLTQELLAQKLSIPRSSIGAYEEDRATPNPEVLAKIIVIFNIPDVVSFISDANYDLEGIQVKLLPIPTQLQQHYENAGIREKLVVNIILGLVETD